MSLQTKEILLQQQQQEEAEYTLCSYRLDTQAILGRMFPQANNTYDCRLFILLVSLLSMNIFVHGFPLQSAQRRHHFPELYLSLPRVINPLTNKKIQIGKATYNDLLREGKYVQYDGALQLLDLDILRRSQEESTTTGQIPERIKKGTIDEWYSLTPKAVGSTLPQDKQHLLRGQLLFVHKPSGLHCVPSRDLTQPSLVGMIQQIHGDDAKPCHRLDLDTSGVVVFGLTPTAHSLISRQFEERTASKSYVALVAGHPYEESGTIDLPIGKIKTPEGFNRWAAVTGNNPEINDQIFKAREAVTKWNVLQRYSVEGAEYARVELEPQTGRGHQLRLHMEAIGHPLLGDSLHAPEAVARCSPRLCLHAYRLQVNWEGFRLEATSVAQF